MIPNPFTTEFTVSGDRFKEHGIYTIKMYALSGNLVYTDQIKGASDGLTITPNIKKTGIYLVSVEDAQGTILVTKRVLKK